MALPIVDISLLGDKALDAALEALGIKVRDRIVKLGTKAGAGVWLRAAKAKAPVGPRKPRGRHLKSTLKVVPVPGSWGRKYDKIGHRVVTGTRQELGIPPDAKYYYPAALEYGRRDPSDPRVSIAQPFLRPAFDENEARVKAVASEKIWAGVKRAAAKAARKTAHLARGGA